MGVGGGGETVRSLTPTLSPITLTLLRSLRLTCVGHFEAEAKARLTSALRFYILDLKL